eukprot:2658169-Prymnesium_polylepis.1
MNASSSIVTRSSRCQLGTPAQRVIMDAAPVAIRGENIVTERALRSLWLLMPAPLRIRNLRGSVRVCAGVADVTGTHSRYRGPS